jgi:hypothetical protein
MKERKKERKKERGVRIRRHGIAIFHVRLNPTLLEELSTDRVICVDEGTEIMKRPSNRQPRVQPRSTSMAIPNQPPRS